MLPEQCSVHPSDAGDESVNNERKEEQLWKVDTDRTMLSQVQDALERIENGTFGNCLADGGPIDENGLRPCRGLPIAWRISNNSKSPSRGERQPCKTSFAATDVRLASMD